jgi:hypothetical protein
MKTLALIVTLFAMACSSIAYAQNGNGNGYGHDKGAKGNEGAKANNGNGNGHPATSDAIGLSSPGDGTEQDIALDAVKAGRALVLSEIARQAVARWGGRVIDAHLLSTGGRLFYRLTMVSESGVSRHFLVDAKTAALVKVK